MNDIIPWISSPVYWNLTFVGESFHTLHAFKASLLVYNFLIRHHFLLVTGIISLHVDEYFCLLAVPGGGVGHRVTQDDEKNKGRVGSQQHHESRKVDPASRLHMTLQIAT